MRLDTASSLVALSLLLAASTGCPPKEEGHKPGDGHDHKDGDKHDHKDGDGHDHSKDKKK